MRDFKYLLHFNRRSELNFGNTAVHNIKFMVLNEHINGTNEK